MFASVVYSLLRLLLTSSPRASATRPSSRRRYSSCGARSRSLNARSTEFGGLQATG